MPGSNAHGPVVACAAYAHGARIGNVEIEDISDVLTHDDRFVWIGLYEPDEALLKQVQGEFGLHDLAIEDAHVAHQRPKLERYGDSLFIALRTAQTDRQQQAVSDLRTACNDVAKAQSAYGNGDTAAAGTYAKNAYRAAQQAGQDVK